MSYPPKVRVQKISKRTNEVLKLAIEGFSKEAIAAALGLSVNTIKKHRRRILARCDVPHEVFLRLR